MPELSANLYELLSQRSHWSQSLQQSLRALRDLAAKKGAERPRLSSEDVADRAFEIGQALRHCEAERRMALHAFTLCIQAEPARVDAIEQAEAIAHEIGDFALVAALARKRRVHREDPDDRIAEGLAWLDAGRFEEALKVLSEAAKAQESTELIVSLRLASQDLADPSAALAEVRRRAAEAQDPVQRADLLLCAARIIRCHSPQNPNLELFLFAALDEDPENLSALTLLETLPGLSDSARYMRLCETRLSRRTDVVAQVDELRRIGMHLWPREAQRGTAVRLLHRALTGAYHYQLKFIPGHLAVLKLLREHCESLRLVPKFLELVDQGLACELPQMDHLFLALQGLDLAWNALDDQRVAQTYAEVAARIAPKHPLVVAATSAGLVQGDDSGELATSFLDERAPEAPSVQVGNLHQGMSLSEQLRAADLRRQAPSPEPHDTAIDEAEARAESKAPAAVETASPIHLDFIDEAPAPSEARPQAAAPEVGPTSQAPSSAPPAVQRRHAPSAPPPVPKQQTLGRISLIPQSAMAALKKSAALRNQLPPSAVDRAPRMSMPIAVEFHFDGERRRAITRDVSSTGAFLATALDLAIDTELALELQVPVASTSLQTESFSLRARIVRAQDGGFGVAFLDATEDFTQRLHALQENGA